MQKSKDAAFETLSDPKYSGKMKVSCYSFSLHTCKDDVFKSFNIYARRSNQSILKEISPGCSLEGLMLKLKLQYFGHLMGRADSFEKPLMLGKIEGGRRMGTTENEMVGWHHRLNGHEFD